MIRIDHYGVEGEGKTITQAKADAGRKIQAMLKGNYTPEIFTYKGRCSLIWREPFSGWYSRMLTDYETGQIRPGLQNGCSSHSSKTDAIQATRLNLAQAAWTTTDGLTIPEILEPDQAQDFIAWARFQLKYQELKSGGLSEAECHRQACDAMYQRPEQS